MENWDLYDKNRNKINKIVKRGPNLNDGEYHLVVNIWIKNSKKEYLITQRGKDRSFPLKWECTGGSVVSSEDSLQGAIREAKEELGINLNPQKGKLMGSTLRYFKNCSDILDVWLFNDDININEIKIQKEEVNDVMWASTEKIRELYASGDFEANAFFEEVLEYRE